MTPLLALRMELAELYFGSGPRREAAECVLRAFARDASAYQLSMELLADSMAKPHEVFFAASIVRSAAKKTKGVGAPQLKQLLHFLFAAYAPHQPVANQLAAAAGCLAVRCSSLPEEQLLPHLLTTAAAAVAAAGGDHPTQPQQCALLKLLAALAEACVSFDVSMHPQQREAVRLALGAAREVAPIVHHAICTPPTPGGSSSLALQEAALQLLLAWCAIGGPPRGFHALPGSLDELHAWLLLPALGSLAGEGVAGLWGSLCQPLPTAVTVEQRELLALLLQRLQPAAEGLLALAAQHPGSRQPLFTAASLLSAAGRALDVLVAEAPEVLGQPGQQQGSGILGGASSISTSSGLAPALDYVCGSLLQLLLHADPEVALAGVQPWDEWLEQWGSAPRPLHPARGRQLERLLPALLQRMMLPPELGAVASADARDLPDSTQLVRRELADTFRAAAETLGVEQVVQQLVGFAEETEASGGGSPWQLEVLLYCLNLVASRQKQPSPDTVQRVVAAAVGALAPGAPPKLAGTALTLAGGMAAHLASRVEEEAPPGVAPAGAAAAAAKGRPHLSQQCYGALGRTRHRSTGALAIDALLHRLLELLEQGDEKLRRNAATCCWRLCSHPSLAAALVADRGAWAHRLCAAFLAAGGIQQRCRVADDRDLTTPEFLLRAVCLLCATDGGSGGGPLVEQLVLQPVAALAGAHRAVAAGLDPTAQQHQQDQQLACCAVQLEALASVVELLSRPGSKAAAALPVLLERAWPVLQGVLDLAGRAGGELLAAACRLAAALAGVDSGVALAVVGPLCQQPREPCVLSALQACAQAAQQQQQQHRQHRQQQHQQQGMPHSGSGDALCLAVQSSIQEAARHHAAEPDWQAPALALGAAAAQCLPAALAEPGSLQALLSVLEQGLRSYHREVCEAAVACASALCCVGASPRLLASASTCGVGSGSSPTSTILLAEQQLRQRLDGGLGPGLLLGLLLAAAGGMPPYMMAPLAEAVWNIWQQTPGERFRGWVEAAVLELAPGDAPWRGWKKEALSSALEDLLSASSWADAKVFKRRVKALCGGKKKGQHVAPPPRTS